MKKLCRICLLGLISLLAGTAFSQTHYQYLYFFGDSLTDTGNLYALTYHQSGGPIPSDKAGFYGRFSNGLLWNEYLAPMLGVGPDAVINMAVAGAQSGKKNVNDTEGKNYPGFTQEVKQFIRMHQPSQQQNKHALYVLWVGADNYIKGVSNPKKQIQMALAGFEQNLQKLITTAGAKYIVVIGLPDLSITPYLQMLAKKDPKLTAEMNAIVKTNNQGYQAIIKKLNHKHGVQIRYMDVNDILTRIMKNPKQYALSNTITPCQNPKTWQACTTPDTYLFWNEIHPTTAVHRILAGWIYAQLNKS